MTDEITVTLYREPPIARWHPSTEMAELIQAIEEIIATKCLTEKGKLRRIARACEMAR